MAKKDFLKIILGYVILQIAILLLIPINKVWLIIAGLFLIGLICMQELWNRNFKNK